MSSRSSRSSARLAKNAAGVITTAPEAQGNKVIHETGMQLDEIEQAQLEIAIEAGETMLVTNDHWSDKLSYEMKGFYDEAKVFGEGLRGKQKEKFEKLMETFEGAATKEREGGPSSSTDAATDKHERMVATKGQNAHLAATTQGKSILEADAEMASAMGKLEGAQADLIARKIKELEALQEQALKNKDAAHKKEVTSKVKDASEKATQAAEERYTRARGEKAAAAAANVELVDKAFHSPVATTTGGTVPASPAQSIDALLPKSALEGALGDQLRALGANIGEAPNEPKKKQGSKRTAAGTDGTPSSSKKTKKAKLNDDGSEMTKADEESNRRTAASKCYAELGIRGPSGLQTVIDRIKELEELESDYGAMESKLARAEEINGKFKDNQKILNKRLKRAVATMRANEWTDEELREARIISDVEEDA